MKSIQINKPEKSRYEGDGFQVDHAWPGLEPWPGLGLALLGLSVTN